MLAVFIKEMRQFRRGYAQWIALGLWVASMIAVLTSFKIASGFCTIIIYPALFLALLMVSGESASTWRRELGDPAFSPGVNTALPPLFIALGKAGALLCQLVVVSLLFSPVFAIWKLVQYKLLLPYRELTLGMDINISGNFFTNLGMVYDEYAVAFLAFSLLMTTVPLAVCSVKPRHKAGGRDVGSWASVAVMGIICLTQYNSMLHLNWKWQFLLNALIFSVGAILLIAARVAPATSDRLMAFKIFVILQALAIKPLLARYCPGFKAEFMWSSAIFDLSAYFAVIALFERLEQSRRVLNIQRPQWVTVGVFPVTTGALNSFAAAVIFFIIAWGLNKFSLNNFYESGMFQTFSTIFAAVMAVNLSRFVKGGALLWFVIIMVVLFLIWFAILSGCFASSIDAATFTQYKEAMYALLFVYACGTSAGIYALSRIYCKKIQTSAVTAAE